MARVLQDKLLKQVVDGPVEILCLIDNMKRSIGHKRQALLDVSRGRYITFVDDDDDVFDDYIADILHAIRENDPVDVICIEHMCSLNDDDALRIVVSKNYPDEQMNRLKGITRRKPSVSSVWRREIAVKGEFPNENYGEDAHWARHCMLSVRNEVIVPKMLHHYRWRASVTRATL